MPQSFNVSGLSLEKAAELVSLQARLAASRTQLEKRSMSSALQGALLGGGLGLGTGLLSSATSQDEDKNWGHNALLGTLLGAGVGGAAGFGMSQYNNLSKKNTGQNIVDKLRDAKAQEVANRPAGTGPVSEWIGSLLGSSQPADFSPQDQRALAAGGVSPSISDPLKPGMRTWNERLNQYYTPTTAGAAAGGYGIGRVVDDIAANNRRVTPRMVQNLKSDQIKQMAGVGPKITQFQTDAMAPGAVVRPPGMFSRSGPSITARGGDNPLAFSTKTVPSNVWSEMQKQTRQTLPVGKTFRYAGAVGGALLTPEVNGLIGRLFGQQAPIK